MNRSTKIRYVIFQILIEIFKKNKNFNEVFDQKVLEHNFNQKEISFINNVCLNSMRRSILGGSQQAPMNMTMLGCLILHISKISALNLSTFSLLIFSRLIGKPKKFY